MSKILVLDNYDSFTYNLVHYLEKFTDDPVEVYRNDKIELEAVEQYDKIVLSPGPGLPGEAGIMPALIERYAREKSILGVCLGHQAIAEAFGGKLRNLDRVIHGEATQASLTNVKDPLYEGLTSPFPIGHYHSWVVDRKGFPEDLLVTVEDEVNDIMGLIHKEFGLRGVQFHPESVLTETGERIISNWLAL